MLGAPQGDEQKTAIDSVFSALGKLKATIISGKDAATFDVGTEHGKLLGGEVALSADAGEAYITSNLFPGVKLAYPKEMVEAMVAAQQQAANVQKIAQLMVPYGDAVMKVVNEEILPAAQVSEEAYNVEGVGAFVRRSQIDVNGAMVMGFFKAINDVLRNDTEMQAMIDNYAKSMPEEDNEIKSAADLVAQIDKMVADVPNAEEVKLGTFTLYEGAEKNSYFEFSGKEPESGASLYFVSGHIVGDEKDMSSDIAVIIKGKGGLESMSEAGEKAAAEAPKEADWAAVKADIISGADISGVLVLVKVQGKTDVENNNAAANLAVTLQTGGMRVGINSDSQTALAGEYKASGKLGLTFMGENPLFTVSFDSMEVTEAPVLTPADDLKAITIQEEMSAEDTEVLQGAVMSQGLPMLIENLKTALPEEGPLLATMLQTLLSQGTSAPN